ncbi:MAG TPA: hypothetical protein VNV41_01280 [Candidatus Acidoferrales bacterium]|jgi:hypothetical protein|nr:hypothetical protein [Candidatus Acidoferrales bacterium]
MSIFGAGWLPMRLWDGISIGGRPAIYVITREVTLFGESGDIRTFMTISPMRPEVVVHSSQ